MSSQPRALYVHIPFCLRRCDYCGFVSSVYRQETADAYLQALSREIERRAIGQCEPRTIYIGGGTPTCLSIAQLTRLLDILAALPLQGIEEWTIEANPNTLTTEKIILLKERGINRVSLGIQAFHARGLRALGRAQDNRKIKAVVAQLREMGMDNISSLALCEIHAFLGVATFLS